MLHDAKFMPRFDDLFMEDQNYSVIFENRTELHLSQREK